MVIVKLKGGLGNQMFQYACGRALSEKNKSTLFLDLTFLLYNPSSSNHTLRNYELNVFNIQERFTLLSRLNKKIPNSNFFYKLNSKLDGVKKRLGLIKKINDKEMGFDKEIFKIKGNICLDGYWQSEKYFKDIEEIIREEFSFRDKPSKLNREVIEKIKKTNSVSVHVRRGDYAKNPKTLQTHGLLDIEYYQNAINLIKSQIKKTEFFVFSDDIEWVKKNLKIGKSVNYISHNGLDKGYEDLRLMSSCKNHIIANSSFSWWGAWLSENPHKIVIAPEQWFSPEEMKRRGNFDTILEDWIKI